jgi:hypothetical protein
MPNGLDPDYLSPAERRKEAAGLLALGFLRWRARQTDKSSHINGVREIPLGPTGHQSSHAARPTPKGEKA